MQTRNVTISVYVKFCVLVFYMLNLICIAITVPWQNTCWHFNNHRLYRVPSSSI